MDAVAVDSGAPDSSELADLVAGREWYHSIELAPGVVTPGYFDLRRIVDKVGLPASLDGQRCLDVGTFDGFWALEMRRRGAAEVLAVDVIDPEQWDWPAASEEAVRDAIASRKGRGEGFSMVMEALGADIRRLERSIYQLDPDEIGRFDFIYVGSLLLHLRDPIGALSQVRRVCAETLLLVDAIDFAMTVLHPRRPLAWLDALGRPWWWKPNLAALERMAHAAGFVPAAPPRRLALPAGPQRPCPPLRRTTMLSRVGRIELRAVTFGDPHAALLLRPAT